MVSVSRHMLSLILLGTDVGASYWGHRPQLYNYKAEGAKS